MSTDTKKSRIDAIAKGSLYWTQVDIVDINDRDTATAIEHTLVDLGIKTNHYIISVADHLKKVLGDSMDGVAPYIVIAAHGGENDGDIAFGDELAPHITAQQDFSENMTPDDLKKFINVKNKIVINTACTAGANELANVFIEQGGAQAYIADTGYPYGYVSSIVPILFFFFLTHHPEISAEAALQKIQECDVSFKTWKYYGRDKQQPPTVIYKE